MEFKSDFLVAFGGNITTFSPLKRTGGAAILEIGKRPMPTLRLAQTFIGRKARCNVRVGDPE